jgi:hypothetical protein
MISPLFHARDIDDHVLRYFQSRADGRGLGFGGRAVLAYEAAPGTGKGIFVRLAGEYYRARVDVDGRREYYRVSEGYKVGEGFPEERTVKTTQYGGSLQIGLTF